MIKNAFRLSVVRRTSSDREALMEVAKWVRVFHFYMITHTPIIPSDTLATPLVRDTIHVAKYKTNYRFIKLNTTQMNIYTIYT